MGNVYVPMRAIRGPEPKSLRLANQSPSLITEG